MRSDPSLGCSPVQGAKISCTDSNIHLYIRTVEEKKADISCESFSIRGFACNLKSQLFLNP